MCTDLPGSPFTCSCNSGWEDTSDGSDPAQPVCANRNECIGFVCNSLATCEDTVGSFVCNCPAGYSGDGITGCSNIDECTQDPSPCTAPAVCIGKAELKIIILLLLFRYYGIFYVRLPSWIHFSE